MDKFNKACIDLVWSYNTKTSKWSAYSPNSDIASKILNQNILPLSSLSVNDGFWIKGNKSCVVEIS